MARENAGWGYDRIVGALANLGYRVSDQTVKNILRRHGIAVGPVQIRGVSRPLTTYRLGYRLFFGLDLRGGSGPRVTY